MKEKPTRRIRAPDQALGRPFILTPRDQLMLKYIWYWKLASTASIHEAYNRPKSAYSTFKVLEKLAAHNLIESRFDRWNQFHVWQLTERGFLEVKPYVGVLKEDGYLSENHRHDRMVQAFQLGEWATNQIDKVEFFTEQQLRRMNVNHYPEWVPRTPEHRADGYTQIEGEKRNWVLAYEVELSKKHVQEYEAILYFYKGARTVDQVLWLVGDNDIRDQILRAKNCNRDDTSNYHVFVDLADFVKNGWDASITNERSENLGSIRGKYQGICGGIRGEIIGNSQGNVRVSVHLDPRKIVGKSKT